MNDDKNIEEVKNTIVKDLFADVDTQKCVIDIFLCDSKAFKKIKKNMENKEAIVFLKECESQLRAVADMEELLFSRKSSYEKILNVYFAENYKIKPEMNQLPSKKKLSKEEKKQRREADQIKKQRELEEKKLLEDQRREDFERQIKKIFPLIPNLKWKKTVGVNKVVYETTSYDEKKIKLGFRNFSKKDKRTTLFVLQYEGEIYSAEDFAGNKVIQAIDETNPDIQRNDKLIYLVNAENSKKKKTENTKTDPEAERKQKEEIERKKREEAEKKQEEAERIKAEKKRLRSIRKREKRAERKLLCEEQEKLQELPQIDVKDFLVRRAMFKCMHSQHQVSDVTAAVKVVGNNGKAQLVKISAGYCKQCKIYFILESTYAKLKSMGVILCRISDEKSYIKSFQVNGMKLAQESILMQFGYTVSQEEDLSATKRHKILAVIIDHKVLSKSEIISYLDFFISQKQNQSIYELAISKWETDREFIQNYRIGEYTEYGVKAIRRR